MEPNKLSKEVLSAYLYDVSTLELAKKKIEDHINPAKKMSEHNDEIMKSWIKPEPPKHLIKKGNSIFTIIIAALLTGIPYAIIGAIMGYFISFPVSWFFFPSLSHVYFAIGVAILVVLFWVGMSFFAEKEDKHVLARTNRQLEETYERELAEYNKNMNDYNLAKDHFCKLLEQYEPQKEKVVDELNQLYKLDIIHPKYRTLEAVLVMYDLLSTGRCDTLKEALNAYEDYLWKKQDAQWKASISQQLSVMCDNQISILSGIDALNMQTARIADITERGLSELNASTEELKLQASIIEGNTRTMALLQTLDFWDKYTA